MGYVSVRQHNKQAILGLGVFSYCVVRGNWENGCKTVSPVPQKGEQRGSTHLQAFISPVVKTNPAASLCSVEKDLSGDIGPVCLGDPCVCVQADRREKQDRSFKESSCVAGFSLVTPNLSFLKPVNELK